MRALSLCQSCKRHIRVSERVCPFCGAAHSAAPEAPALKPRGLPGSRAALFLAGAAAAPGCVEDVGVPVYGIPIDPDASSQAPDGGAARDASGDARDEMIVPVYGVPVYGVPVDRDASTDANLCGDPPEPMAVPVYGIPLDSGAARDAGNDAGACGQDAGVKDAGPIVVPPYGLPIDPLRPVTPDAATQDGEILGVPVYGVTLEIEPEK